MTAVTGLTVVADTLAGLGVDTVYTVAGTQTVGLLDALRSRVRLRSASHELHAAFMAIGHSRRGGAPGVLLTIPGPGFTYALTGLAEALHDAVPLLFLVGRPGDFQYLEQATIAAPLVKSVLRAECTEDVADLLYRGYRATTAGTPGPVLVELPLERLAGPAAAGVALPRTLSPPPPTAAVTGVGQRWRGADRPVLLVGEGALEEAAAVVALAERRHCPVITTPASRGVIGEDHPLAMGVDFVRSDVADVNAMLRAADVVLAVGCRFTYNSTAGYALRLPETTLIRVDAEAATPHPRYPASLAVPAPIGDALRSLLDLAPAAAWTADEVGDWRRRLRRPVAEPEPRLRGVGQTSPAEWVRALRRVLPRQAVVVLDAGRHQELVRRHLDVLEPRTLLFPSDFQSMGFGIPAAIGAKAATPGAPVVAIVGDGGFAMTGLELLSAVREQLPIVVVVVNDGALALIRAQQHAAFGRGTNTSVHNPRFELLAASVGAGYLLADGDWVPELTALLAADRPAVVELRVGESVGGYLGQVGGMARTAGRTVARSWLARLRSFFNALGKRHAL